MAPIKLKLSTSHDQPSLPPPSPSEPPTASKVVKLKLGASQPSTSAEQPTQAPVTEKKKPGRKPGVSGAGKKRAAEDDILSPAAKRIANPPTRKFSLKLGPQSGENGAQPRAPSKIALAAKKKASMPKIVDIRARGRAPPRPPGVGYDSEDSETEKDPAIQQALVLRMEPGEDADYLRDAIANGQIGPHPSQGDAEVSIKFVEKTYRRAIIKIRGRMYAAALVDLPCVVESMKSFDRKGWWKVADVAQMLLVLGRIQNEEEAKTYELPREVRKGNYHYAHGLTPPMHWVRKRRFRKRLSYNQIANIEEEVERLLALDKQCMDSHGTTNFELMSREQYERSQDPQYEAEDGYDDDADADGEAIETTEMEGQEYEEAYDDLADEEEEVDAAALEAQMMAEFNDEPGAEASELLGDPDAPIVDKAATMAAVEKALMDDSQAGTPAETPAGDDGQTSEDEEEESDEDDEDSPDVIDEDAVARAAERAQQLEEVADLEREVERARQKVAAMTNMLLRKREEQKLSALEEDLRVKRMAFGLDAED